MAKQQGTASYSFAIATHSGLSSRLVPVAATASGWIATGPPFFICRAIPLVEMELHGSKHAYAFSEEGGFREPSKAYGVSRLLSMLRPEGPSCSSRGKWASSGSSGTETFCHRRSPPAPRSPGSSFTDGFQHGAGGPQLA